MRLPIHDRYDFTLPATPVVRVEEAISEKLVRYRRVSLARDLYDLQWYATSGGPFDEALVRRLWVLKVYRDVVVDARGTKPISQTRFCGRAIHATSAGRTSAISPDLFGSMNGSQRFRPGTNSLPDSTPTRTGGLAAMNGIYSKFSASWHRFGCREGDLADNTA